MIRQTITTIRYNKTYCTLLATMILAAYAVNLVPELNDIEPYPDYYFNVLPKKLDCNYDFGITRNAFKDWGNCFSYQYLENDRVLPIISSIVVVYLVYVLANQITNNRIIGLIAMGAISINPLLTKFDSSPTYDQLWAMLFLISMVLLYRNSFFGVISFPLTVFTKVLAAGYIPGLILNILIDKRLKHRKILLIASGFLVALGGFAIIGIGVGNPIAFHPERTLEGFLRIFENIWPVFPALIGAIVIDRFFMPKQKPDGKNIVIMWMTWILLTTPLIYIFTESQYQFGYRFVPFAAFFSIYLGIVCVQLGNFIIEARIRKHSLKSISQN